LLRSAENAPGRDRCLEVLDCHHEGRPSRRTLSRVRSALSTPNGYAIVFPKALAVPELLVSGSIAWPELGSLKCPLLVFRCPAPSLVICCAGDQLRQWNDVDCGTPVLAPLREEFFLLFIVYEYRLFQAILASEECRPPTFVSCQLRLFNRLKHSSRITLAEYLGGISDACAFLFNSCIICISYGAQSRTRTKSSSMFSGPYSTQLAEFAIARVQFEAD